MSTSPVVRPDTTLQAVNTFINVGETEYDALLLQLEKRLARGFSARVSYTLSSARGNTSSNGSGAINFQAGQDLNLEPQRGRRATSIAVTTSSSAGACSCPTLTG